MDQNAQLEGIYTKAMEEHKKDFEAFFNNIQEKLDEEKAKLDEDADQRNSDEESVEEAVEKAYADAIAVDTPNPLTGKVRKEETDLFAACNEVIATSDKLVERFTALEAELKTHFWEHSAEKWQKDKDDLVEIMALGRQHGEKLVNNVLAPTTSPAKLVNAKATAHEKTASDIFQESRKVPQGDLWGTVAGAVVAQGKQLNELAKGGTPVHCFVETHEPGPLFNTKN